MEQHQGRFQSDGVHALAGAQAGKAGFFFVVASPDLHERSVAAHAHADRFAGDRVDAEFARLGDFVAGYVLFGLDLFAEGVPEAVHQGDPVFFAPGDGVEFVFQFGGEVVVDVAQEVLSQEAADDAADVGGPEAALVHLHVFAALQGGDDAGVGGGAADAVFLQGAHQRGLGVARRRLGEVLFGADFLELDDVAFFHGGQHFFVVVAGGVVLAFQVDLHEAGHGDGGAGGAQGVAFAAAEVHGHLVDGGVDHLAGDGALPDEVVELVLVGAEIGLQFFRRARGGGGAHRLVGFLGVFGAVGVGAWAGRDVVGAVALGDEIAQLGDGVVGQGHRVGPHVGDQAHRAVAGVDAFVELLRGAHGALRGEAQFAHGLLLEGGGGEGRGGVALALFALHPSYGESAPGGFAEQGLDGGGLGLVDDGELLHLFAAQPRQAGDEVLSVLGAIGLDGPVLLGLEAFDLFFPLNDHA